jgi:transposase
MEFFTTQMPTFPFLALPAGFEITAFSQQEGTLCVSLLSTQSSSRCPLCGSSAIRVHSRYQRTLVDLPSAGQPVRLVLFVRQFFCDVTTCAQKIFVERLAPFVEPRSGTSDGTSFPQSSGNRLCNWGNVRSTFS